MSAVLPRPAESETLARLAYLGLAEIGLLLAYAVALWLAGEKDLLDYLLRKCERQRLIAAEARIGTTCGMIIELRALAP